jgi:hypothetical protein
MGEEYTKKTLYMPIVKDLKTDKLVGILSSNAVDREDEIISSKLLSKWKSCESIPALTDHKNSVSNYAGGWKNFRLEEHNGNTCLIAEPVFFKSNPHTAHLEAMVKEAKELGLPFGISIGAIVKSVSSTQIGTKNFVQWDDAELLEASWVAIPANQTAGVKSLIKDMGLSALEESDIKLEKKMVEVKENEVKAVDAITMEQVKAMIAQEVESVKSEMKSNSEKSETELTDKISSAIAKALDNLETSRKSMKVDSEKELDITNLTNG